MDKSKTEGKFYAMLHGITRETIISHWLQHNVKKCMHKCIKILGVSPLQKYHNAKYKLLSL